MKRVIAYQGVPGAYSHLACQKVYPDYDAKPCDSFLHALTEVEGGNADLAMIPLENSTAGRVEEFYRLLPNTSLEIVGEHFEAVNHCLLGLKNSTLNNITEAGSHPQALAQCHNNLLALNIQAIAKIDTAGAAQALLALNDSTKGAIASSLAAKIYDLKILKEHFNDVEGNTTRFVILAKQRKTIVNAEFDYITSLLFTVRNIPAALYKVLGGFATNGLNLIKIESYMDSGTLQSSRFHVDIATHIDDPAMLHALEELEFFATDIKRLGCYRAAPFRK
jgi:prephenate dehydratase